MPSPTPTALALAAAILLSCTGPPAEPAAEASTAALLDEIGRAAWQLDLDDNPWLQVKYGVAVTFPDLGPEHAERRSAKAQALLDRLAGVEPEALDHSQWVILESLRWDLAIAADKARFYWLQFPIAPYTWNWLGAHMVLQSSAFDTPEDAGRYLELARRYPAFLDALRTKLEGQQERGIVLPVAELDLVVPSWQAYLDAPETVFPPFAAPPDPAAPEGLRDQLAVLVEAEVRPAWQELVDFLEGPYRDAAPTAVGLGQYPGGDAYYAHLVRESTTLERTPEEIHRLGVDKLAATAARMDELRGRLGFAGTRDELHRQLATDPRFFATTADEVRGRLLAPIDAIEPAIDAFFERRPRAPFRLTRLAPGLEAGMTYGYYQEPTADEPRGTYYYNGSRLDERSLLGAAALVYHEIVPGHHFQVALTNENTSIPDWRRDAWHDAFGEGWAEYASMLAEEMGMYADPWDLYGLLAAESFFYARLVVDTGMNHLGWSRQQAMEYMAENTLASTTEIETETLRYAVDIPAQALAYAVGAIEIERLRERARAELGERFDIRRFHAAVIDHGSMPLAVLERHVEWFIAEELRR